MKVNLRLGDCLDVLRGMDDASVDSIVTDPPYGIAFMAKSWDYQLPDPAVWVECLRVLKPGGHLIAFSSARTYHRMASHVEDGGFEIRDMGEWLYGSGMAKSHNLKGEFKGFGTALKPAHEPFVIARKPFKGTVAANVLEYGTGALNIDACRVGWPDGKAPEIGTPGWGGPAKKLTAVPGQEGETVARSEPSELGRWPANLIHDGSEEAVSIFPDNAGARAPVTGNEPSAASTGQVMNMRQRVATVYHGDKGSAARFFYCAKASPSERHAGCDRPAPIPHGSTLREIENMENRKGNYHATVKPVALMRYLVTLVTPPGGLVVDPFMGSGTTGIACVGLGFDFIGIEMDEGYFGIAFDRINHAQKQKARA